MKSSKTVRALVESAMMVALSTVLSILKIVEMPYGGSVTVASMLPMIILSYRQGMGWGLGSGAVYAALQQLLGLNSLSYVTGWQSVLAVILLDYIGCLCGYLRAVSINTEACLDKCQNSLAREAIAKVLLRACYLAGYLTGSRGIVFQSAGISGNGVISTGIARVRSTPIGVSSRMA